MLFSKFSHDMMFMSNMGVDVDPKWVAVFMGIVGLMGYPLNKAT